MTPAGDPGRPTGAILAGGGSRRMGRPKAPLPLPDGRSMIDAVAMTLEEICAGVVVVGPASLLPDRRHLADLRADAGPLGGLEALLASGLDDVYLVCPCDVPLVSATLLRALLTPAAHRPMTVLHLDGEDDFRPLPARVASSALVTVREHLDAGRRAVHALVRALDTEIVPAPAAWATQLTNVNTPEDYREL